ncbi:mercury resistance system substrate-binding protein MerP [Peribacillus sp. FSL M8-0224]|uniref:mercury resistance system substrate-binding protein MerP n=1 Tax=Peribacillus sp. FSL M8-0224 TaxID=2921568 RepID=UPI0030F545B2
MIQKQKTKQRKTQQHMIVAVWRGLNHEGKSVASSHCIFGFCYGCMLPGAINFHSSWINWVCRSISLLLTEISVNVQHCYHHPSCLLLLYGLREKEKKKKFCHWLLLVVSACSNEKEAKNTIDAKQEAKATIETTKAGTFTVLGMDCCPPSVVERVLKQVDGVSKTAIKVNGSMSEVTVSFDDKKTDLQAIKTAVLDFGLGVE